MPRDAFVLKIQRKLCHPKWARKVSGLSRNGPHVYIAKLLSSKTNRRLFGIVGSRINFIGHSINRSQFVWCFNAEKCFSVCFFSPAWEIAQIVENDEERRRYCLAGFQLPKHRFSCWKSLVTTIFELVSGFLTKKRWKNV